ncbi:L,D-transpeptidase family protein [Streptomyces sp. NPDC049954]|uniref:L,D-transpeptidase family protein n=1 Tax=Streptomyces sp. NPDC049954 TaxID=3155779 RepID=UPI0034178103
MTTRSTRGGARRGAMVVGLAVALAAGALGGCRPGEEAAAPDQKAPPRMSATAPGFRSSPSPHYTPAPAPLSSVTSRAPASRPAHSPSRQTSAPPAPPPTSAPPPAPTLPAYGQRGDQVRELQARLWTLGHFRQKPTGYYGEVTAAAVSAFQRARGLPVSGRADAATWRRLRAVSRQPGRAELYPVTTLPVTAPDARCRSGRVLCVSKRSRTLAWMVDGRTRSVMDVRFGSAYTPTRDGAFTVYWKSRHHVSTLYDSPMPYAMFFSGGQAVHFSSDFAARGYSGASHGCVNVRDEKKIAALFATVRTGDKVVVY